MAERLGRSGSRSGFTLVELMVTVAVIGVAATAVVLTAAPPTPRVQDTAERFAARLTEARSEAILGNRSVSVRIDETGYRFEVLDGREWLEARRPLEAAVWGEGVGSLGAAETWTFDATGAAVPAGRVLQGHGRSVRVAIEPGGEISLGPLEGGGF
jgi:general secretion pathway protein H